MGRRNYTVQEDTAPNPLMPLLGFIVFLIVGGLAFWSSPSVVHWLSSAHMSLAGGLLPVLPIEFPAKWSPIAKQLVVSVAMFMVFFTIVMTALFFFMKPPNVSDSSVSLNQMRKEKKKMKMKRHR
jgi:hypothetical protein